MRYVALSALLLCASTAWSQDAGLGTDELGAAATRAGAQAVQADNGNKVPKTKVANPFDAKLSSAGMGMGEMMGGAMGGAMGGMGDDMEGMGMMSDMGMGSGMEAGPSPDQLFRHGLQRAIQSLKKAKTDSEREVLRGYIRIAFEGRYENLIARRKQDLERLKRSVVKLEDDLKRREAAKDRVVQLQLQSVQLAAEGLLELGELQGVPSGASDFGGIGPGGQGGEYGNRGR